VERPVGRRARLEPAPAIRFVDERLDLPVDDFEPFERGPDIGVETRYDTRPITDEGAPVPCLLRVRKVSMKAPSGRDRPRS
jgi:hypothetical protein